MEFALWKGFHYTSNFFNRNSTFHMSDFFFVSFGKLCFTKSLQNLKKKIFLSCQIYCLKNFKYCPIIFLVPVGSVMMFSFSFLIMTIWVFFSFLIILLKVNQFHFSLHRTSFGFLHLPTVHFLFCCLYIHYLLFYFLRV